MKFTKANRKINLRISYANGSLLFDENNNSYIDFVCGRGTANIGHCHPHVSDAISRQSKSMIHFTNEIQMPIQEKYVKKLGKIVPEYNTVYLANSGSEAVEAAIKLSRIHTNRHEIISFFNGFHGRSMGALSATYDKNIKTPFTPLLSGFYHCPLNTKKFSEMINKRVGAVIIEPVQGAGGVNVLSYNFLAELKEITNNNGSLLIFDECQSGFGRTGNYFAYQRIGVIPDILIASKSICGGIPAGAIFTKDIDFPTNSHGGTFCGNPLSCAAGLAVLEVFENERILKKTKIRENIATGYGDELVKKIYINDFRQLGLMIGIEFDNNIIDPESLFKKCLDNGLLINIVQKKVIRILPSLNIEIKLLKKGFKIIFDVLEEISKKNNFS